MPANASSVTHTCLIKPMIVIGATVTRSGFKCKGDRRRTARGWAQVRRARSHRADDVEERAFVFEAFDALAADALRSLEAGPNDLDAGRHERQTFFLDF